MKKNRDKEINKESRVTERALYASLLAVVLCCVMLFESTYAWFTQTVSTPVSVIQTGNMSANLVMATAEATFMDAGEYVNDSGVKENNLVFREYDIEKKETTGSTVFEPGKSYCLPEFHVQNTGNIDLNFTVTLAHNPDVAEAVYIDTEDQATQGEGEDAKALSLYDVLEFKAYVSKADGTFDLNNPIPLTVARGESDSEAGDAGEAGSAGESDTGNGGETGNAGEAGEAGGTGDSGDAGNAGDTGETGSEDGANDAGSAGDDGDGNGAEADDRDANAVTGVLLAPVDGKPSISGAIVIQATMDKDAGIEYSGLELSGLQIIVNTSQVIPEEE